MTFRGTNGTGSPEFSDITLAEINLKIAATVQNASAFMPLVAPDFRGNDDKASRIARYTQRSALVFNSHTYESSSIAQAPTEQAYNPTARDLTMTMQACDAEVNLYAKIDGSNMGQAVVDQIVQEAALAYIDHFDGKYAALYTEAPSSSPDHEIGASTAALTGPLIDNALALLIAAKAPKGFALVIHDTKIPELMQIPGMRELAILGKNGGEGGLDSFTMGGIDSKKLISGYAGVLDIYHSDKIVSSTGYHNLMFAVGDRQANTTFVNPFIELRNPLRGGPYAKMMVDLDWISGHRVVAVNITTIEAFGSKVFSSTTNKWMVDITTA